MTQDLFAPVRDRLAGARLEVYVSTFCFDCSRLKKLLENNAVAFAAVNINSVDGAADRLEAETGKRGVPYVLVNGQHWVRGYHLDQPGRLNPDVFVAELAKVL